VISKPYTLTLTLSHKGEGINGWKPTTNNINFGGDVDQIVNYYTGPLGRGQCGCA
jgi:hypothetical protein